MPTDMCPLVSRSFRLVPRLQAGGTAAQWVPRGTAAVALQLAVALPVLGGTRATPASSTGPSRPGCPILLPCTRGSVSVRWVALLAVGSVPLCCALLSRQALCSSARAPGHLLSLPARLGFKAAGLCKR